jgi:hypothetical protein
MYTGHDSHPYMGVMPPWPLLVVELRRMGMFTEAGLIADALEGIGWRV